MSRQQIADGADRRRQGARGLHARRPRVRERGAQPQLPRPPADAGRRRRRTERHRSQHLFRGQQGRLEGARISRASASCAWRRPISPSPPTSPTTTPGSTTTARSRASRRPRSARSRRSSSRTAPRPIRPPPRSPAARPSTTSLAERKLKPADVDLGLITRDKIIDPKVADAAFSLAPNAVSGVVDGQFGPVIVRVTTVQPEVVKTFDEAKADIKQEIADERAAAEINDQHDVDRGRARRRRHARRDRQEIRAEAGHHPGHRQDRQGRATASRSTDLPGDKALLAAAFDTDVGIENDPVADRQGGFVWYEVTAVTAPRDRTLDEVRDKVVAAWKQEQGRRSARRQGRTRSRDRLAKGDDIAKIAADLKLEVKTAGQARPAPTTPAGDLSAAAVNAAFAGPKGTAAVADGTRRPVEGRPPRHRRRPCRPISPGTPDLGRASSSSTRRSPTTSCSSISASCRARLGVALNQAALAAGARRSPSCS